LGFGSELFQVAIPSTGRDSPLPRTAMAIPVFPFCDDEESFARGSADSLVLYSDEWVRDDVVEITLSYEESLNRNPE
jgi:hypothetical protein